MNSPTWAPEGTYEQHISGDIAFAVMLYFRATKDLEWMSGIGFALIESIAQFWESRVYFNQTEQLYVINQVISPDENAGYFF